jgi:uncharacterized protein (DUF924 family)
VERNPTEILDFWFGADRAERSGAELAARQASLWWGKDAEADGEIARRFTPLLDAAAQGDLESWSTSAEGRLALIIVLDQFSRNAYRDTPDAFAQDRLALAHSLEGQSRGQDRELRPIERVFFYMPMEHAESLPVQDECVRRFRGLLETANETDRDAFAKYLDFAERHREIILRFDRFPHRNPILGRTSTPDEEAFLREPGSGF